MGFSYSLKSLLACFTLVILTLNLQDSVDAVDLGLFYPFGPDAGDNTLSPGDDTSSTEIFLDETVVFYDKQFKSLFVNVNGHVSFGAEVPNYRADQPLPYGQYIIAVFLADVDTRASGRVYYRSTSKEEIIQRAAADIQIHFAGFGSFLPTSLFIVTWDRVGYFEEGADRVNTFQMLIVSDGQNSFTIFHYLDDGIQWVESNGKFMPTEKDLPPQAGFDGGKGGQYYILPGSAMTGTFTSGSNVNFDGVWMYQIGNVGGGNVRPANSNSAEVTFFDLESANSETNVEGSRGTDSCSRSASTCHENAICVDHDNGFCCQCQTPYYGNGLGCLEPGKAQTVNGPMAGTLNGKALPDDLAMHTYVLTNDGRTYSAISRVPADVGTALLTLNSLGGIIGWLFAVPLSPRAKNGYHFTGGKFNRTTVITFQMADRGDKVVRIFQTFNGHNSINNIRVETTVEGDIPEIPINSVVSIDDYTENYKRTAPGVIRSFIERTYRVNNVAYQYSLDTTISFTECNDGTYVAGDVMRLNVNRHYVKMNAQDLAARMAMTSKVGVFAGADSNDPCYNAADVCDTHARCIPEGESYRCVCRPGYKGDGKTCQDIDECQLNPCHNKAVCLNVEGSFSCQCMAGFTGDGYVCRQSDPCFNGGRTCAREAQCVSDDQGGHRCVCRRGYQGNGMACQDVDECQQGPCDPNAICYNVPGSYQCRCQPGFQGDGRSCQQGVQMCGEDVCSENARCVYGNGTTEPRCQCIDGFRGDGLRCAPLERNCNTSPDICSDNAQCVFDEDLREYVCECMDDFSGDGFACEETNNAVRGCDSCDRFAQCVLDITQNRYSCQCNPGYTGDGTRCTLIDTCRNCDRNARCVFDDATSDYQCVCVRGYQANGTTCELMDCRKDESICAAKEEGGICWTDPRTDRAICRCNYGFRGDGFNCDRTSCDVYNDCNTNAKCVQVGDSFSCQCNEGYEGSGKRCKTVSRVGCEVLNDCDTNARCLQDPRDPSNYMCRCNPGYRGDGKSCLMAATPAPAGDCNVLNDCSENAICMEDSRAPGTYMCRCNRGFRGDGKTCREEGQGPTGDCNVLNDCSENAICMEDSRAPGTYMCRCNRGFRGDGKICSAVPTEDCNVRNDCSENAICMEDSRAPGTYMCRCNRGFRGDGKICREDAPPCNTVNNCDRNAECMYNPDRRSYSCVCKRGYEGNGVQCRKKEVPDCRRTPEMCSDKADCARGSDDVYVCVCKPGYRGNGVRCSHVVREGGYLIYAQGNKIMKVKSDPQSGDYGQQIIYRPGGLAVGVTTDCQDGDLYWTDASRGAILRSKLDGSNIETIITGMKSPEGIAVDHSGRNLFFTDSEMRSLYVARLNGSDLKTLVDTDMVNPRAVVLDNRRGVIYWTDWNRNLPQIERVNMDGTDRDVLVSDGLKLPNGLVFDSFSQTLCWGDAGSRSIECIRSDGVGRRQVYDQAMYPFDITLLNNVIYWTDWRRRDIPNINQNGKEPNEPLSLAIGGHGKTYGITAVRDTCPQESNSCGLNNGGCKFLCLPTPSGGRTCGCPDGVDPRICQNTTN